MRYLSEFRAHWRPLLGAFLGLGFGLGYTATTTSVFAPHLLEAFGWSRAQFALTHTLILVMVFAVPLAGRLTDVVGVRRTAMIGVICLPISYIAYGAMTGDIRQYLVIYVLQGVTCATTSATVYTRVVVDHFKIARGLALALGASGPALNGFVLTPLLNELVDAQGWRTGYHAVALFALVGGCIALLLIPPRRPSEATRAEPRKPRRTKEDYAEIARMPIFWQLVVAILLCNMPMVLNLSQLNLMLLDNGVTGTAISIMLSAFSLGILVGRFLCGIALDRFPLNIVVAIGLGLPAIGLLLIASPYDAPRLLACSVFLIGFSYGAEGDLMGYMVARVFGFGVFSTVLGLLSATISISLAAGAALLSLTLGITGGFALYLCLAAGTVVIGSTMLLLVLGRQSPHSNLSLHQAATASASPPG